VMCDLVARCRRFGRQSTWQVPTKASTVHGSAPARPRALEALFRAVGHRWQRGDHRWVLAAASDEYRRHGDRPQRHRGEHNSLQPSRIGPRDGGGGFSQVRVVGLGECATHGITAGLAARCRLGGNAPGDLSWRPLPALSRRMLLADRYSSFRLWKRPRRAAPSCRSGRAVVVDRQSHVL